jgi:putative ABC transport system substrate-binding protein
MGGSASSQIACPDSEGFGVHKTKEAGMRPRIAGLPLAVLLGLAASFGAADAQQSVNIPRVGFFRPAPPSPELSRILESFKQGLREQGYVDGQNVAVEVRHPTTTTDQLSSIAAELVRLKPDAIFAAASSGIDAVRSATTTIPIVALDLETDPLASGIVASLARPGGNVTGIFLDFPELGGKWLELVTEVAQRSLAWPSSGIPLRGGFR